jgi:threonine dehydratase
MRCAGCGAEVDGAAELRFTCPRAEKGDDVDHLLTPIPPDGEGWPSESEINPFVRYRELLYTYRLARAVGMSDAAYCDLVLSLDDAVMETATQGFGETLFLPAPALGKDVWIKDEAGCVGNSHKSRHLMGLLIALRIWETAREPEAASRRLAIASCGNAAEAAAVLARAAGRDLDVFIPEDADDGVVRVLERHGATLQVCRRGSPGSGDPCMAAFRAAVQNGAIPFSVQGPENGLVIEGISTAVWEMIDTLKEKGETLGEIFIQVGGGALASGLCAGLVAAHRRGVLDELPVVHTVQTQGAHPLERALARVRPLAERLGLQPALDYARTRRSGFMWPWESIPKSVAHGILDDETYDWVLPVEMMIATGGSALVVDEAILGRANRLGRHVTSLEVSATATAGLAGMLSLGKRERPSGVTALLFTGMAR